MTDAEAMWVLKRIADLWPRHSLPAATAQAWREHLAQCPYAVDEVVEAVDRLAETEEHMPGLAAILSEARDVHQARRALLEAEPVAGVLAASVALRDVDKLRGRAYLANAVRLAKGEISQSEFAEQAERICTASEAELRQMLADAPPLERDHGPRQLARPTRRSARNGGCQDFAEAMRAALAATATKSAAGGAERGRGREDRS